MSTKRHLFSCFYFILFEVAANYAQNTVRSSFTLPTLLLGIYLVDLRTNNRSTQVRILKNCYLSRVTEEPAVLPFSSSNCA
uniref:hypothetical protein n=1 Tax=Algoriphagus sp. TaxID=1872435 RepID=UPI004048A466